MVVNITKQTAKLVSKFCKEFGATHRKNEMEVRSNLNQFLRTNGIKVGSDEYLNIFQNLLFNIGVIHSLGDLAKFELIYGLTSLDELNFRKKELINSKKTYYYFQDGSSLEIDHYNQRIKSYTKVY